MTDVNPRLIETVAAFISTIDDSAMLAKLETATRKRRMVLGPHKVDRNAPLERRRKRLHRVTPEELSAALATMAGVEVVESEVMDVNPVPMNTGMQKANEATLERDFGPSADYKTYTGDFCYKGRWYRKSRLRMVLEGRTFTMSAAGRLYGRNIDILKVNKTKASCVDLADNQKWSVPIQHILDSYMEGTFKP